MYHFFNLNGVKRDSYIVQYVGLLVKGLPVQYTYSLSLKQDYGKLESIIDIGSKKFISSRLKVLYDSFSSYSYTI